jgi:hypothetical protein
MAKSKSQKLSIIEPKNLKEMVSSVKRFSDLPKTGNVIAVSTKGSVTKE